jgi:uncharacterized protein (TIGR02594 family)
MPDDPIIRGPFTSMDHCLDFKSATEEGDPNLRVECALDAGGQVFARVRRQVSAAAPSVNPALPAAPPAANMDQPGPLPDGPAGRFVSARRIGPRSVLYIDEQGRDVIREGGSRAWRNCNPGNITKSAFADNAGAIGDDGAMAIFPSESAGFDAIIALLRTATYRELSLQGAIFRYAPPSENDSAAYVAFVVARTGIGGDTVLKTLPVEKLHAIATAIKAMEGWTPGEERRNLPTAALTTAAGGAPAGITSAAAASHEWMDIAMAQAALPERERSGWADPGENPRILEYFRVASSWFEPPEGDETDWCAAFVNFCLIRSGHIGTDHPGARSFFWNRKGQFVPLPGPAKGAIAVRRFAPFDDPAWTTGRGHVGFVTSFTGTHVTLLGGNQGNTVNTTTYPLEVRDSAGRMTSKFVAFMMPVAN